MPSGSGTHQPGGDTYRIIVELTLYFTLYVMSLTAASSWIQVNLGQTRKITGIVIQGCPQNDQWVTKFKIEHSMDGSAWTAYTADGAVSKNRGRARA